MIKKLLIKNLHDVLKPLGFVRKASTWNRTVGDFIDIVNIQRSQWSPRMTINFGVTHVDAYKTCWTSDQPTFIDEARGTIRSRLGELVSNHDEWWDLENSDTLVKVPQLLQQYGLPFLDSLHSIDALAAALEKEDVLKKGYPPPHIYLAVLKEKQGKIAEAKAIVEKLSERISPSEWKDAANGLLAKYNVQLGLK